MKYITKFGEQLNKNNDEMSNMRLDSFYKDYKKIFDYNEDDFEQGDEPSNYELMMAVGQLTLEHDMTREDVKNILDNYDCRFDINHFLQSTYDEWVEDNTEKSLEDILRDYEVYNPKVFIKYLKEKGYKIVKINKGKNDEEKESIRNRNYK